MSRELDDALRRYRFLKRISDERAERAAKGPMPEFYEGIGVIKRGEKTDHARDLVESFHDEISKALEQVGFLGVVSAFETEMGNRIKNAIGFVRGAAKDGYPQGEAFAKQVEGFVREPSSFESIKAIEDLIGGHVDSSDLKSLRAIRGERNRLAHGTSAQPVSISPEDAHRVLTSILNETGPQ